MDHIPLPENAIAPRVPYVANNYDYGDFATFPDRQGMSDDLKRLEFSSRSPGEYQSFFQTWLYFGSIIEVFKVLDLEVNIGKFVKEEAELGPEVTSIPLNVYIDEWKYQSKSYRSEETRRAMWKRICSVLDHVRATLDGPVESFTKFLETSNNAATLPYWSNLALSFGVLGWSLQQAGYLLKYEAPMDWKQYRWGSQTVLKQRLQQSGWCSAEVKRLLQNESIDFLLYVGAAPSPRKYDDHSECNETICRGRAFNVGEYQTKHVPGCPKDSCKQWELPKSNLDIIERHGIPLASWSEAGLQVLEYDKAANMPYVAISHIWSDGKGNPDRNSLPECQLRLIQEKINQLYSIPQRGPRPVLNMFGPPKLHKFRDPWRKPVGFWMDTLCVPVGEVHKEFRKQTISQMRQIYEDADRVLVLDDWLEQLSISGSVYEISVRLSLSNWQHRLWTLQEGVLAQQLYIQFRDGQRSLDQIKQEAHLSSQNGPSPQFWTRIGSGVQRVPIFNLYFPLDLEEEHIPNAGSLFSALVPALNSRTTTKFEDETICMATLLHLDTKLLQNITKKKERLDDNQMTEEEKAAEEAKICDARMERFLCMVGSFEQRIIFNQLPRLRNEGFRWAPRSFLGQSRQTLVRTAHTSRERKSKPPPATILYGYSTLEEESGIGGKERGGLLVLYPGIKLKGLTRAQVEGGRFYVTRKSRSEPRYRVFLDLPAKDDPTWKHEPGEYALITSDIVLKSSREQIPSVFGVLRGRNPLQIRKLQHLCLATVDAPHEENSNGDMISPLEPAIGTWLNSDENQWCVI